MEISKHSPCCQRDYCLVGERNKLVPRSLYMDSEDTEEDEQLLPLNKERIRKGFKKEVQFELNLERLVFASGEGFLNKAKSNMCKDTEA